MFNNDYNIVTSVSEMKCPNTYIILMEFLYSLQTLRSTTVVIPERWGKIVVIKVVRSGEVFWVGSINILVVSTGIASMECVAYTILFRNIRYLRQFPKRPWFVVCCLLLKYRLLLGMLIKIYLYFYSVSYSNGNWKIVN